MAKIVETPQNSQEEGKKIKTIYNPLIVFRALANLRSPELRHQLVVDTTERGGDVRYSLLGLFSLIVVSDPDLLDALLRQKSFQRSPLQAKLVGKDDNPNPMYGHILASEGAIWSELRKDLGKQFNAASIGRAINVVHTQVQEMINSWGSEKEVTPDIKKEIYSLFEKLVPNTLLNSHDLPPGISADIYSFITQAASIEQKRLLPFSKVEKQPGYSAYISLRDKLIADLIQFIDETDENERYGMLDPILKRYHEEKYSGREAAFEFIGLYTAAFETTSHSLMWAIARCAERPEIWKKLHNEAKNALEGKETLTHEDVRKLPLALSVVKEAIRLYPPVETTLKVAIERTILKGNNIRKGDFGVGAVGEAQRNPAIWGSDVDQFNPERMSNLTPAQQKSFRSFSEGNEHVCLGQNLALMEAPLALALIALNYPKLEAIGKRPEVEYSATLTPKDMAGRFSFKKSIE